MTKLTPHQEQAVKQFCSWYDNDGAGHFYLAGFAGTGKSTILPYLVEGVGLDPSAIKFCAPTGKAAKVMTTKMQAAGLNAKASTIHKLIYQPIDTRIKKIEADMANLMDRMEAVADEAGPDCAAVLKKMQRELQALQKSLDEAMMDRGGLQFTLREMVDFDDTDLIVVDEASMVGSVVARDLLSFGVPILAIGDPGQLPPVNDEAGFTSGKPDAFLSEIHRQASDNPIIWLSKEVREGRGLRHGVHGDKVRIIGSREDVYTADPARSQMVIVGRNATRWKLTEKIRKAHGYLSSGPAKGEPLIVCKNSKNFPSLVNGSFVTCAENAGDLQFGQATFDVTIVDEEGIKRRMTAYQPIFEEHKLKMKGKATAAPRAVWNAQSKADHFDFGLAITCHKSQGSQWNSVVVHDESMAFREDWSRWLYTAITRAADELIIVK